MTVETKDILLKAAEDVSSGMHCKGNYFALAVTAPSVLLGVATRDDELDRALKAQRCAMGSIAVATALLGGTQHDYEGAITAVAHAIDPADFGAVGIIAYYNDHTLPDDPFAAGQQLAKLFRTTAESL